MRKFIRDVCGMGGVGGCGGGGGGGGVGGVAGVSVVDVVRGYIFLLYIDICRYIYIYIYGDLHNIVYIYIYYLCTYTSTCCLRGLEVCIYIFFSAKRVPIVYLLQNSGHDFALAFTT
jgi:hypothetical protein